MLITDLSYNRPLAYIYVPFYLEGTGVLLGWIHPIDYSWVVKDFPFTFKVGLKTLKNTISTDSLISYIADVEVVSVLLTRNGMDIDFLDEYYRPALRHSSPSSFASIEMLPIVQPNFKPEALPEW